MAFVHRHKGLVPYLLLLPGLGFLALFFVVPIYYLAHTSLQTGSLDAGYAFTWAWENYTDAISTYHEQLTRSLLYAGIATVIALAVSYPLAYWIAFRGGRWKTLLLLIVIAPFFVTYLIRTLAWLNILADEGPNAMLIAGGTDLLPNMKRRQMAPRVLISLRQIQELKRNGSMLGAGTTLTQIINKTELPLGLRQAAHQVAPSADQVVRQPCDQEGAEHEMGRVDEEHVPLARLSLVQPRLQLAVEKSGLVGHVFRLRGRTA